MRWLRRVSFSLLLFALLPESRSQDLPVIRPAVPESDVRSARTAKEPATEEHWQVISVGNERVGYARTVVEPLPAEGDQPQRLRTKTETKMSFKRFGQTLSIGMDIATVETMTGELLSYEFEMGTTPTGTTKSVGTVQGDKLQIKTTIAGTTQTRTLPWDTTVKSPAYQERLLREEGLKPGDVKNFRAYVPEFNQVTDIRIAADEKRDVKLPSGEYRKLLKAKVTQSLLPTMPMTVYLDDEGELVLVESDLLGQKMQAFEVSKAEALKEIVGAELDLAVNTLIPATPIPDPHNTKKVVYRIHTPGTDPAPLFVSGGTQSVKPVDNETVEVTVTAQPVPQASSRNKVADEYTKPTQQLQSNDPAIRDHLLRAVSNDRSDSDAAVALEKYVYEKLDKKNFSTAFASAAEVAKSLEGDCSEHSVLLAALLRARKIPSRIAVGIVYVPGQGKMGGHMWTEAFLDGTWVPLDATLGRGGIGAGHIKVAESSLADDAPLPVLAFAPLLSLGADSNIEAIKVER